MCDTLGAECVAYENIGFVCSQHDYTSLMLMWAALKQPSINTCFSLHELTSCIHKPQKKGSKSECLIWCMHLQPNSKNIVGYLFYEVFSNIFAAQKFQTI